MSFTQKQLDELLRKPGIAKRNASLLPGGVGSEVNGKPGGTLVGEAKEKPVSKRSIPVGNLITVSLVAMLRTRMDPDNLATAFKPLQDAIASELGVDDGDQRIRWEYGQHETRGGEEVIVRMRLCRGS